MRSKMREFHLPKTIFQTDLSLRIRRPNAPGSEKYQENPPLNDNNGKEKTKYSRARIIFKLGICSGLLVVGVLAACKPFFVNFFEEVNFFLHHISKTTDRLLLKRRKKPLAKIIYYVHLSKCGGTSIMDAAYASGLSVPIRNGLTQRDWRCCGEEDSMQAQSDFAQRSPFDFVATESDMYDAMDTDHYSYVVTLRNSRDRYKSQWAQWQKDPVLFYLDPMDFKTYIKWFFEDNFMFRKICGSRCRGTRKFQIPREHFQYTLDRLEKFDSILFLENFQEGYSKFAQKHGWSAPEQKKRVSSGTSILSKTPVEEADEADWDFQMSALDDALYEYAKRVDAGLKPYGQFTKRTQENVEVYFASSEAKRKKGKNPS